MANNSKRKGDRFEFVEGVYMAAEIPVIERIPAGATADRGDLWLPGHTLSLKNVAQPSVGAWLDQAEVMRGNNGHAWAWLIHKRRGVTDPGEQFATCAVHQLRELLRGGLQGFAP